MSRRDTCAACRLPRRVRKDGRVEKHNAPRPSDGNWVWRSPQNPGECPGSGEPPLDQMPRRGAQP